MSVNRLQSNYLMLGLVLAAGAGCESHLTQKVRSAELAGRGAVPEEVKLGFGTGDWHFFWDMRGSGGIPIEAFLKLHAKRGEQVVWIEGPNDLAKLVGIRIGSPSEALSFVRLFSDGESYYRFTEPLAFEYGGQSPKAVQLRDSFVVTRQLVFPREILTRGLNQAVANSVPVFDVKETLFPDGRYVCEKLKLAEWISEEDLSTRELK